MNTAEKRGFLERTARERPEYGEILGVFREIYLFVEGKEGRTGISFLLPETLRAERVAGGFPLLSPEGVRVDRDASSSFLRGVIGVMKRVGREGKDSLDRIDHALQEGRLDLQALYAACIHRERAPLDEAAEAESVPSSLLEFLLEIPVKTALERFASSVDPGEFGDWKEGHCPVCGGRPGMDELVGEEGKRYLSCSACFFRWPYKRLKCPYCGNEDPDLLTYFQAGEEPTRVGVCRKCARYIKTRDSRKGRGEIPLEVEDLATLHLDLLAGKEGFERGK